MNQQRIRVPFEGNSEIAPDIVRKVADYLRCDPQVRRAELSTFLRRECALSRRDARLLARAISERAADRIASPAHPREEAFLARSLAADGPSFLRSVSFDSICWPHVLELARSHQAEALLYRNLVEAGIADSVSAETLHALEAAYRHEAAHSGALRVELGRVLTAFRGAQVETILLKGAAIGPTLYEDPATRAMNDLDLLIHAEDVERAEIALQAMGYRLIRSEDVARAEAALQAIGHRSSPLRSFFRSPSFVRQYGGNVEYAREVKGIRLELDLHWQFTHSEWLRRTTKMDIADIWRTSRPWTDGALHARQLSPQYAFFSLTLHLLKHGFGPGYLRWLADLDRLLRACVTDLSGADCVAQARDCHVATALYAVLTCCSRLLHTPLPLVGSRDLAHVLAPPFWRRALLDRLLFGAKGDRPPREVRGWTKFMLQFLLLDPPARLPGVLLRLLFPERAWLISRYALEDRPHHWWRYRLSHPFRMLTSGRL